ncbi:helix-turn-helix transcriptional regulator [Gloeocapsopsis crepidinum LEGE 06123]|uniref:Helix-turn-helix transcriptional regulator n=1 Tax=Gloeocapsopsis crepidinum LEGE 06123 TaxID=588587 RepID=A0ABR9UXC1_9CHRO|nr:AraC family transcriptional regulator [Gloeocapsopsis crepidinum]MBE9192924.1 helix-turn-helix transcriptional regulator [Gloeocapsopsis crepidinum LEGE 06123]
MTLIVSMEQWHELLDCYPGTGNLDAFETRYKFLEKLGQGFFRKFDLSSGIDLEISHYRYRDDVICKESVHEHEVQFMLFLTGATYNSEYSLFGGRRCYLSGSGIAPACTGWSRRSQPFLLVDVHIEPESLADLFVGDPKQAAILDLMIRTNEWKPSFFPTVNPAIQKIAWQIVHSPFAGGMQRLYLQAKVLELLSLLLEDVLGDRGLSVVFPALKSATIDCLHQAKAILTAEFDNPPLIPQLAQQVGISERTLHRGFQALFKTSVLGYLMRQRMEQAEHLLRAGDYTVAEVANMVGYEHLGHFAAVFKRQFGLSPRECLAGKKAVLG